MTKSRSKHCSYCGNYLLPGFELTQEEVAYLVQSIQHEYLNKDTYYFSSGLFGRMEVYLKQKKDELARRASETT